MRKANIVKTLLFGFFFIFAETSLVCMHHDVLHFRRHLRVFKAFFVNKEKALFSRHGRRKAHVENEHVVGGEKRIKELYVYAPVKPLYGFNSKEQIIEKRKQNRLSATKENQIHVRRKIANTPSRGVAQKKNTVEQYISRGKRDIYTRKII
jgi:hypothetical protein